MRSVNPEKVDDPILPFRRLAEGSPQHAGAHVEEALRASFRGRRAHWERWRLVVAAAVIGSIAGYFAASRVHKPSVAEREAAQVLAGFTPLPYAASGAPLGEAVILRMQLPMESVEVNPAAVVTERTRFVPADVLIGQDGVPRAIRVAR